MGRPREEGRVSVVPREEGRVSVVSGEAEGGGEGECRECGGRERRGKKGLNQRW